MENYPLSSPIFVQKAELSIDLNSDLESLAFTLVNDPPAEGPYVLNQSDKLKLVMPSGLSMSVDFTDRKYQRSFKPSSDLLCRACGWHLGLRNLWDLTAGLGADSVLLAQAGFQVKAFERNKYLVLLLREAQRQLHELPQLSFEFADSEELFSSSSTRPEVLYYDPMYPAKRKTALPSKEMQILRELNGTSGESVELMQKALSFATKRVVVKRPQGAPPIIDKPNAVISGKLVRYDIYLAKK